MPHLPTSRRVTASGIALLATVALAGCGGSAAADPDLSPLGAPAPRVWPGWEPAHTDGSLTLASDDFTAGGELPRSIELNFHGCTGENVRPELHWDGLPEGTKSVVLTFTAEGGGPLNRWTVVDIPPDATELAASAEDPATGTVTQNSTGGTAMIGPCALEGENWELWFTAYALDTTLDVAPGASTLEVTEAGAGHVLEAAELNGFFAYEAPTG